MKLSYRKIAGRFIDSLTAALSRFSDNPSMAKCRACGKQSLRSRMSEIPYHGLFCNDDEATKYWNEHFELAKPAETRVPRERSMDEGVRLSRR